MKFLIGILFGVMSFAAQAEITVINPSNKASPATVLATAYKDALGSDVKFYQSQTCEDAQEVFNSTKNAVMIYNSSIEFAARDKGLNCKLGNVSSDKAIFIGKQYMSVCTSKDGGYNLSDDKVTMGMPSMYSTKLHEADFRASGINVTLVPFGGSKDIINAVLSKSVTYGFIATSLASKQKDLTCVYSTNPEDNNYIGKRYKLKVPDFKVTNVIYTNSTDANIISKLKKVETDPGFTTYLNTSGIYSNWNVMDTNLKDVIAYVDSLVANWSSHSTDQKTWWFW